MEFNLFNKINVISSLTLSLLLFSSFSYANDSVLCPLIDTIKADYIKLDTAQKINEKYITYTSTSVYQSNNLWWFVGVGDISAASAEQAVKMGRDILKNSTFQIDIYAIQSGNEYICNYGPGYIQARGKQF